MDFDSDAGCRRPDLAAVTAYQDYGCRCPRCVAAEKERNRRYRDANLEKSRERSRRYHAAHREEIAERQRQHSAERRARLRAEGRAASPGSKARQASDRRRRERYRSSLPKTNTGRWTAGEDAVLAAWEGTLLALAAELGRSYDSVRGRRRWLRRRT